MVWWDQREPREFRPTRYHPLHYYPSLSELVRVLRDLDAQGRISPRTKKYLLALYRAPQRMASPAKLAGRDGRTTAPGFAFGHLGRAIITASQHWGRYEPGCLPSQVVAAGVGMGDCAGFHPHPARGAWMWRMHPTFARTMRNVLTWSRCHF
jgi:hypothetical protein